MDCATIMTDYAFIGKEVPIMPAHYRAAANVPASLAIIDDDKETLTTRGIILGGIQESVEPFIDSLVGAWEDSTKFTLQLNKCKSMIQSLRRIHPRISLITSCHPMTIISSSNSGIAALEIRGIFIYFVSV